MCALGATAQRDARVDALKGVAIACVVLFHVMGQYWLTAPALAHAIRQFVAIFMLPLFACLSGWVLGRVGGFRPRSYFVRRTLGLMVPYFAWELIYAAAFRARAFASVGAFGRYVSAAIFNPHAEGRMWYLYVLWVSLIVLGVCRLGGDRTWVAVVSVPLVILLSLHGNFRALEGVYPFVVLGHVVRRYQPVLAPALRPAGIAGAVAFVPLWFVHGDLGRLERLADWSWPTLGSAQLYVVSLLLATSAIAVLASASAVWPHAVTTALAVPGRLSLGIYVSHFLFVEIWHQPSPWLIPVIFSFALVGGMAVTLLLQRWNVSATVLLGERWRPRPTPAAHSEETL